MIEKPPFWKLCAAVVGYLFATIWAVSRALRDRRRRLNRKPPFR